jgi:hypothetical protein
LNEDREEFKDDNEFNHGNLGFEISEQEVTLELAAAKNGKAAGPVSVPLEMLKYGGNKIVILLTKLYMKIIQGGKTPEQKKLGYISSIHKKGDQRSCSNYRGICVINPIIKTFGRLIKHRLEEEYVSLEEQCGFMTGRSCTDHISILRQILEKCQEKSKQIGIVFIDTEKACDSVPRKLLWQAIEQASISEHIVDILKSMYSNNTCQVKVGSPVSREFYTSKGLLQGC